MGEVSYCCECGSECEPGVDFCFLFVCEVHCFCSFLRLFLILGHVCFGVEFFPCESVVGCEMFVCVHVVENVFYCVFVCCFGEFYCDV